MMRDFESWVALKEASPQKEADVKVTNLLIKLLVCKFGIIKMFMTSGHN